MRPSLLSALALVFLVAATSGDSAAATPGAVPARSAQASAPMTQAVQPVDGAPARSQADRPATTDGLHAAPALQDPNAPPEAQLNPPANAEKAQQPPGFVEVKNPAFP